MGAWGTGLFSDDVACDVRVRFRELLSEGSSIPQITRRMLEEWREAVEDEEDGPVIWLALASLQWDQGALQAAVKKKALRIIDQEADLDRWRSNGDARKVQQRKRVLDKLRAKLESPPPEPKAAPTKTSRPKKQAEAKPVEPMQWRPGQVFAYRLRSGDWILLHVVECNEPRHEDDRKPTFAVLDWQGKTLPTDDQIQKLPYKKPPATTLAWGGEVAEIGERRAYCLEVAHRKLTNIPVKRLQRLSVSRKLPFAKPQGWNPGVLWRLLDAQLEADLGLR